MGSGLALSPTESTLLHTAVGHLAMCGTGDRGPMNQRDQEDMGTPAQKGAILNPSMATHATGYSTLTSVQKLQMQENLHIQSANCPGSWWGSWALPIC